MKIIKKWIVSIIPLFSILLLSFVGLTKGNLPEQSAKNNNDTEVTATVSGMCRHVVVPEDDKKRLKVYGKLHETGESSYRIDKVGILYQRPDGNQVICFDDLAINPFIQKNIEGDKVSLRGEMTTGQRVGLEDSEVFLGESMELIDKGGE